MNTLHTVRPLRRGRRLVALLALATLAVVLPAAGASAHVRVTGPGAAAGSYGVLTFQVPTESATASTTELKVTFPAGTPISSVSTQPMAGWTATVTSKKLPKPIKTDDGTLTTYVAQVDWKANRAANGIKPGQFQLFNVLAGPLPDVDEVSFPSLQYYSDGSTVNWNEQSSGGAEPEHPAPVLPLAPAAAADGSAPSAGSTSAPSVQASTTMTSASSGDDSTPAWPGIAGLVAGVLALVVAGLAFARTGRAVTEDVAEDK